MYISIAIVYMLLFIDLLAESTMSPTLTLNEKFLKDCQLLSPIFKDKHLCFGGKVSFLTSTPEIGEAVHITVTSADSKITKMSAHIAFDDCGKPPLKTEVLEVCACTSEVGNKSFTYLCAMTFNTSYSGSIINAFLEYLNGSHAKDVLLKLPAINKEESTSIPESTIPQIKQLENSATSIPESTIPQIKQLENSDKCEKVYIGISVPLVFVIVILTICCICLWRQNRRLVKEIQAKDETLTRIQAGSEKGMQEDKNRDFEVTEVQIESREMSGAMQNSRAKYLKSMSNDSDAAHTLGLMEEDDKEPKTNSTLIPLMFRLPDEGIQAAKHDEIIEVN